MSDLEMLLDTIEQTGELPEGFVPNTRIEHYLVHLLQRQGREGTPTPISRADVLLAAIDDEFAGGGGGGVSAPITDENTFASDAVTITVE